VCFLFDIAFRRGAVQRDSVQKEKAQPLPQMTSDSRSYFDFAEKGHTARSCHRQVFNLPN
jgi:hypothetical protein